MLVTRALAASAALILLASPASAQRDLFYDTVDVRVVNLEVVVTDEDGAPVRGLARDDFELLVDGRPTEIGNFFAVEQGSAVVPGADGSSGGEAGPEPETQNLNLVVFVDDVHTAAQNRNQVLANLRRYLLGTLAPGDRVMLARLGDTLEVVQELTDDRQALAAALDRMERTLGPQSALEANIRQLLRDIEITRLETDTVNVGPIGVSVRDAEMTQNSAESQAGQIETLARQRRQLGVAALSAMRGFVDSLAGMKGRKALLYVSDGIPLNPGESLVQAWLEKYERWIVDQGVADLQGRLSSLLALDLDLTEELETFNHYAGSSRVAIYPITLGSRIANSYGSAESRGSGNDDGRGGGSRSVATFEQFSVESTLLRMADQTGGTAFTRSANVEGLLGRVKQDFETFYSLGYAPDEASDGPVDVEVRVRRAGSTVRHVHTVEDKDPLDRLQDLTLSALHHGIEDNPLEVRLDPGEQEPRDGGRFQVPVMVKIPFSNLLLLPQESQHAGRVTLFVIVRDEGSRGLSPFQHVELPLRVPNDQILQVLTQTAAYPLQLVMTPGRKRISVGVRDHLSRTDATVSLELEVGAPGVADDASQDTADDPAQGR